MPHHGVAVGGGVGDEGLAVGGEALVDAGEALEVGERRGVGVELGRYRRIEALVGAEDRGEGVELHPAHEQLRRARDHRDAAAVDVELRRHVAAGVAVVEAEAGDAAGEEADHRGLDAVVLVPGLHLVAEPEERGDAGAAGEAGAVEEGDVLAAAGLLDRLAADPRPFLGVAVVPDQGIAAVVEAGVEHQPLAEVVHPAGGAGLADQLVLDHALDPGARGGVREVDHRRVEVGVAKQERRAVLLLHQVALARPCR